MCALFGGTVSPYLFLQLKQWRELKIVFLPEGGYNQFLAELRGVKINLIIIGKARRGNVKFLLCNFKQIKIILI